MLNSKLTSKYKKIFCFDAESNGLAGEAFAIGAVVMDWEGQMLDQFSALTEIESVTDPWVKENVLPHLSELRPFNSKKDLRDSFWQFYLKHKENALCLVDCGVPVESNLIQACILDDPEARTFVAPYPLYDLSSFLLTVNLDPIDLHRKTFVQKSELVDHNPLADATASALTLVKLVKDYHLFKKENQ